MPFAAGETHRLPSGERPAWFARVLDEIARTNTHPITIAIRMSNSHVVTGHLEGAARGASESVEVWKPNGWQGQILTVPCDEIDAFKLLPDRPFIESGKEAA